MQLVRLAAAEAIVNEQHVVLYDGYAQKQPRFWNNLLPKVMKKAVKKKIEEVKVQENVGMKLMLLEKSEIWRRS